MYLVTTALREFWPESGPIWLLSPGCFPDLDTLTEKSRWEIKGIVSDPFANKQDAASAYAEIWSITNNLISLLANGLNKMHGTDHSERYWRTYIGFWVLHFVTVVYDRYTRLLKAKSQIENIQVISCHNLNPIIPSDTRDFVVEATDDSYNQQICTFLCEKLEIPIVYVQSTTIRRFQSPCLINTQFPSVKSGLRSIWYFGQSIMASMFANRADVLMVSSYLPRCFEAALSFVSCGRIFPLYNRDFLVNCSSNSPIHGAARAKLSLLPEGCSDLMKRVVELVGMCLPKSFVESYQQVCSYSDKIYKNYRPKAIYSANLWYFYETFKHWAAKCQEQGTILIGGEHGGFAFVNKFKLCEFHEVSISDYYLTWGWIAAGESKRVPVPANKLVGIPRRRFSLSGDGILYVGTTEPRHNVQSIENFHDYLEWRKRFFSRIPHKLTNKFLVRMHYQDHGWKMKERLLNIIPTLQFDSWEVSLRKRFRDVRLRLYVFDYIGTTFVEALASNVPTIVFLDEVKYPVCEAAISQVQRLKDVQVLHNNPECAADWVAQVYDNPSSWWFSNSCQKVVREFCYLFAHTSETALWDWKMVLETLLECEKAVYGANKG